MHFSNHPNLTMPRFEQIADRWHMLEEADLRRLREPERDL
jgi:hypothetical protein